MPLFRNIPLLLMRIDSSYQFSYKFISVLAAFTLWPHRDYCCIHHNDEDDKKTNQARPGCVSNEDDVTPVNCVGAAPGDQYKVAGS